LLVARLVEAKIVRVYFVVTVKILFIYYLSSALFGLYPNEESFNGGCFSSLKPSIGPRFFSLDYNLPRQWNLENPVPELRLDSIKSIERRLS
jgi:hypothetical protein